MTTPNSKAQAILDEAEAYRRKIDETIRKSEETLAQVKRHIAETTPEPDPDAPEFTDIDINDFLLHANIPEEIRRQLLLEQAQWDDEIARLRAMSSPEELKQREQEEIQHRQARLSVLKQRYRL